MKNEPHPHRRAIGLLLSACALVATPAVAQDATSVAPPPVRPTLTPVPAPQTPPPSAETGRPVETTQTGSSSKTTLSPEAQAGLDEAREQAAARPARAAPVPRRTSVAPATMTRTTAAAPAQATVAPPVATAPPPAETAPVAPPPVVDALPPVAEPANTPPEASETVTAADAPVWPWVAGAALAVVALVGLLFFRRRRDPIVDQYSAESDYAYAPVVAEPAYAHEPAYVAEPAAPPAEEPVTAVADDASVTEAEASEVAALTEGAAPVQNRPWLEFAMRPVRAGTSVDEAMVEIELTVANAGNVAAEDVRVSTFMLTEGDAGEIERLLIDPPARGAIEPVTIQPGEGTRIDATLAALKADVRAGGGFAPVVVADARYRLPDGREGRTSASFLVGVADDHGGLAPFDLGDRRMHEDVEARLHGTPQRV